MPIGGESGKVKKNTKGERVVLKNTVARVGNLLVPSNEECVMSFFASKRYQRVTNFAFAAILVVSTFTASVPFLFSKTANAVSGTTYTVCEVAGPDCTYTSIQDAIDAASTGDTVKVAPGTYTGDITINKDITVMTPHTDGVIAGQVTIPAAGSGATLKGFTVQTTGKSYSVGISNADNVTIDNNTINHTSFNGSAKAIYVGDGDNSGIAITHNYISTITSTMGGAYGILVNKKNFSNLTISNNYVKTLTGVWTHAIGLEGNTPNAVVANNHVSGLSTYGGGTDIFAVHFEDNASASTVSLSGDYNAKPLTNSASTVYVNTAWATDAMNAEVQTADGTYRYIGQNAFSTIQAAIDGVNTNGTIVLESDVTVPAQVNFNKTATLDGNKNTVFVSGTGLRFLITAAGSTIEDLNVTKTDKTGEQNIIGVQAPNVTIDGVHFTGQFNIGDGQVSRAIVISSNDFTIENSTFNHLRQPAYINGFTGTINNNYVSDTKGWVVTGDSNVSFTGNSWGTNAGHTDIAIIDDDLNVSPTVNNYTCDIMAQIKADNNNAGIDNQVLAAPCTPTDLMPIDGTYTNNKNFENTWTAAAGAVGYEYQTSYTSNGTSLGTIIYHDSSVLQPSRYDLSGNTVVRSNINAPDATYYWQVRAIDSHGQVGLWSVINKVTVDTVAPRVSFQVMPPAVAKGTIHVRPIVQGEVNGSMILKQLYIDGNLFSELNSIGRNYDANIDTTALSDGSHTLKFVGTDQAGNASTVSVTFIVDNTAPTATIDGKAPVALYGASTTIHVVTNDDNYLQTDLYKGASTTSFKTYTGPTFKLSWLPDGDYRMVVRDQAGNSTEYDFTVDKTAPAISVDASTSTTNQPTITGTVDADADHINVTVLDGNNTVVEFGPATYTQGDTTWSYATQTALPNGTYTVIARAYDVAGNFQDNSADVVVAVAPAVAPATTTTGGTTVTPTSTATPLITPASAAAVLGATDDKTADQKGNTDVKGATDDKTADAVNSEANNGTVFGIAWYWWILILAALALIVGYIVSAIRRRNEGQA